jgi:PAS domain S-box-containing protein
MITSLLTVTVLITASVLTWETRRQLLARTQADAILIAEFLARMSRFTNQVQGEVEETIGEQMVAQATLTSHLVAIAEQHNVPPAEINRRLKAIADQTTIDEFRITDERGRTYLHNLPGSEVIFSSDAKAKSQFRAFWPLLTGKQQAVIQEAQKRQQDNRTFKYVGVGGVDHPRIVQIGEEARTIERLQQEIGLVRLVNELIDGKDIVAIRIVNRQMVNLARNVTAGLPGTQSLDNPNDVANLQHVLSTGKTLSYLDGSILKMIVPIPDSDNKIAGATVVYMSTAHLQAAMLEDLKQTAIISTFILAVGVLVSILLARKVTNPIAQLTLATTDLKTDQFQDTSLATVAARNDELGVLARVFKRMAKEVREREQSLKQAQTELRHSEAHFRSLIENASDIVTILTREGTLRYGSPSLTSLGYQSDEIVNQHLLTFVHPEDAPTVMATFNQTLQHPGVGPPFELRFKRKDGSWVALEAIASNLLDKAAGGIILNLRDITERKQAESLQIAKDAAEQANQAKSQFLANMSHELRTPLNAIIGYSEMLQEEAVESEQTEFVADLQKIYSAGKHLLTLINDILDLSKVEAGKMDLCLETFEIPTLIEEVVNTIQPLIEKNHNTLVVHCPAELGSMHADLIKVRQNLFNLLSNACKFTDQGTITLTVEKIAAPAAPVGGATVAIASPSSKPPLICFRVSDTGIGMTPDQVGMLFQAFTQVDASTTRKYGGTGLGLAIAQRFAQMMGGLITVESALGQGTTFEMQLPVHVSSAATAEFVQLQAIAAPSHAASPTSKNLVLVIDDDPTVHDLMKRLLTREGFQMSSALNAQDGLRLAKALQPAVITLDVMMSGMDGWTTLTALKSDPELAPIPVIMITMVDNKTMGYALGASDYLIKPIDRSHFTAILNKYRCEHPPCSILLVEDDPDTREMVRRMLEKAGWQVIEAENGRVALERLAQIRPTLIVLDLMMAEMDGFSLIAELQQQSEWRSLPVIVMTAKDLTAEDYLRLNGSVERILQKGASSLEDLMVEVRQLVFRCIASDSPEPQFCERPCDLNLNEFN